MPFLSTPPPTTIAQYLAVFKGICSGKARRAGTLCGSEQIDGLTSGHHAVTGDAVATLRPLKEDAEQREWEQNGNCFSGGCISPRVAIFTVGWEPSITV